MFIFIFIYDYYTMLMNIMVTDELHRSMAISMAIEQCTPGTETIGR